MSAHKAALSDPQVAYYRTLTDPSKHREVLPDDRWSGPDGVTRRWVEPGRWAPAWPTPKEETA